MVNNDVPFLVSEQPVPWVGPDQNTKYLGKQFGLWIGLERPQLLQKVRVWGGRIHTVPLKPEQRLEIWRDVVLPRLSSALINTGAPKTQLAELDSVIHKEVKRCLYLPEQVTDFLFYTPM